VNLLLATDASVERSGVCLFILNWVREIRKYDSDSFITIYFRKSIIDNDIFNQYKELNVDVILGGISLNGTNFSSQNRKKIFSDIQNVIRNNNIDIVHVNSSAIGFSSQVLKIAKKENVPIRISHSHGKHLGNGIKNLYLWYLKRCICRDANVYAGCSLEAGKYLFGNQVNNSDKWHFIPNTIDVHKYGFDPDIRDEYRQKLSLKEDDILLGATGMLTKIKNHAFLLPLIYELNKTTGLNYKLVVFGEGEERKRINEIATELGITDSVVLYGVSSEISNWLSAMDVYVMPSLTEGLPIGAVEAQANGLTCILSDCISNDIDIADVIHIPIDKGIKPWMDTLAGFKRKNAEQRLAGARKVIDAGFDISSTRDYILKLYGPK